MISRGFFKSSLIYTFIGALPLASQLVLLPFYTNSLSTHSFGLLAIYTSFALLVQMLVNFGLDTTIGIHYFDYKNDTTGLKKYMGIVASALIIMGILFTVLLCIGGPFLFDVFDDDELQFYPYGFLSVLTAVFSSFFRTYSNLLTNQQRPERFFWINLSNFIITIIVSLAGIYLYPGTLAGPIGGRFLAGMAMFLVTFFFMQKEFGLRWDKAILKSAILFSFPILLYNIMSWVLSFADRYIINYFMKAKDVGVFDFAIKCTIVIEFIQAGLGNSIFPKIYSMWKDQDIAHSTPEVNKYYSGFTALSVIIVAVMIITIPLAIPLFVYKPDYYEAFVYTPLICLGFLFRGLFNMYLAPIYFFKRTSVLPRLYLVISIVQLLLEIVLIKYFGLWGAVWALLIIKPLQALVLYTESRKLFGFSFNKTKLIGLPVMYSAAVIVLELLLGDSMNRILLHAIELAVAVIAVAALYKQEMKQLKTIFLKPRKGSKV